MTDERGRVLGLDRMDRSRLTLGDLGTDFDFFVVLLFGMFLLLIC